MAAEGPRGGKDPLELQGGDHVGIDGVVVSFVLDWDRRSQSPGDRITAPTSISLVSGLHVVVDGPGLAGRDALLALGADAAVEAALRLPLGLFLGVTLGDFLEAAAAVLRRQGGHHLPGRPSSSLGTSRQRLWASFAFSAALLQIHALQVAVDGLRRLDAAAHRLDGDPGPVCTSPAGKDPGPGGLVGDFIHFDGAPAATA